MRKLIFLDAGKEIIKSTYVGSISEGKAAGDGVKRSFSEHVAPDSDRSHFQFQRKQIRTQHAGEES